MSVKCHEAIGGADHTRPDKKNADNSEAPISSHKPTHTMALLCFLPASFVSDDSETLLLSDGRTVFVCACVCVGERGGGAVSICRFDVAEPDALRPLCLTSVLHSFVEKSLSKGIRTQEKPVYRREPRQTQSNPLTCVKNEGNQPRPINSK